MRKSKRENRIQKERKRFDDLEVDNDRPEN